VDPGTLDFGEFVNMMSIKGEADAEEEDEVQDPNAEPEQRFKKLRRILKQERDERTPVIPPCVKMNPRVLAS
jgi:Ca2+-binding EF-hand superfamily protein